MIKFYNNIFNKIKIIIQNKKHKKLYKKINKNQRFFY